MINGEKACNQCMVQSQPITTITNKKQHTHTQDNYNDNQCT